MEGKGKKEEGKTISDIVHGINPNWRLEDWFKWPPDLFLLCSHLLKKSGG
jgi:hypothetical protein